MCDHHYYPGLQPASSLVLNLSEPHVWKADNWPKWIQNEQMGISTPGREITAFKLPVKFCKTFGKNLALLYDPLTLLLNRYPKCCIFLSTWDHCATLFCLPVYYFPFSLILQVNHYREVCRLLPRQCPSLKLYRVFPTCVNTPNMNTLLLCAACVNKQMLTIS